MNLLVAQAQQIEAPEIHYGAIAPVLIVLGAACVSVLLEALLPKHQRWAVQLVLSLVTLVGAGRVSDHLRDLGASRAGRRHAGGRDRGRLAVAVHVGHVAGAGVRHGLLLIADRSVEPGGAFVASAAIRPGTVQDRAQATKTGMQTEVFPLTLFALGGMMTFVASNDLLTMFIALEVMSLPLYLLCGLARRRRLLSQEAAVKYFLLGAFASAFFLYGVALLYGYAGSVKLSAIATAAAGTDRSDTLLFAGFGLLVVGLLFKARGRPVPLVDPGRLPGRTDAGHGVHGGLHQGRRVRRHPARAHGGVREHPVGVARRALRRRGRVDGDRRVLGLTQTDVKRMIAYSSVAHAGFLLIGSIALTPDGASPGVSATMFYLLAYGFTTIAAFGVVSLVRNSDGEATHLSQWAGLAKRSPVVAAVFTFLLLALAGIPLTSGFIGKFVVFSAAIEAGLTPLVVIALVASAVAAFFYLRVIVLMYFSDPAADGPR